MRFSSVCIYGGRSSSYTERECLFKGRGLTYTDVRGGGGRDKLEQMSNRGVSGGIKIKSEERGELEKEGNGSSRAL
jgi:hypothetical protein